MADRRTLEVAFGRLLGPGLVVVFCGGCALSPLNGFLDQTKVGRFGLEAHEGGIRRVLTARDTPPGLAEATEPTPDDVVAVFDDYRLGAGDTLELTIPDLLVPGQPFAAALEVSALGEIRVPELGSLHVAGLTEHELEQEIEARLKEKEILPRPVVTAFTRVRRGRVFTAMGAVGQPGLFPVSPPGMRLLDAIGAMGDVSANAKRLYVIRRQEPKAAPAKPTQPTRPDEFIVPPPMENQPPTPSSLMLTMGSGAGDEPPASAPTPPTKSELEQVLTPADASSAAKAESAPPKEQEPGYRALVFDPETGAVTAQAPPAPPAEIADGGEVVHPEQAEPGADFEQPFDWEKETRSEFDQRVLEIDLAELRAGNPRYNVVVHDGDVINVPTDTGVFYMMGEVNRPGVYAFGGRDITLKQAMAIVGGFSPMAWPMHCELVRREPGTDKQVTQTVDLDKIFAGLEDDIYLRDDDIINVGSNVVAPFLYVIRNSFRFTYGFGFVYDRNFADKDAYSARINPETLDIQRRQSRGLPF